jgi:hypothetical protein
MPKKLRPAVDLMAFKCRTLKVKLQERLKRHLEARCGNACTAKNIVEMKEGSSGFALLKVLENVQEFTQ